MKLTRSKIKRQNLIQFSLLISIIVVATIISQNLFFRLDLTSEGRYTISSQTKKILKELDDVIYFKVYLEGDDLTVGYKRLRDATKEMLDELRVYANENIQYSFENPYAIDDKKTKNEIFRQLYKKGLDPINIEEENDEGKISRKVIFPGVIANYGDKTSSFNLIKESSIANQESDLNKAIQDIEYKLVDCISKLKTDKKKYIGFLEGHGELDEYEIGDLSFSLSEYYNIVGVKIDGKIAALKNLDAIIIANPITNFSNQDKYVIDQFIMNGGKVLWMVDFVQANMDSLENNDFLAVINTMNINDMLFKYGARVNPVLVQDLQCAKIPLMSSIGESGEPKIVPRSWFYFPVITNYSNHSISKNINIIKTQFVGTIDTVGNDANIKKTFLLKTSKYCKTITAPLRVSLDITKDNPNVKSFTQSYLPIAVLLEGKFNSIFKNRYLPGIRESKEIDFKEKSVDTKMIVIADGDIAKNDLHFEGDKKFPMPLGRYNRDQGTYYRGNKEFLMNAINYLVDNNGIMSLRSREIRLRLLDRLKAKEEAFKWKMINTIVPILFIILFGLTINFIRKRKYTS